MAEGELLVGFELYDALGYIERLDPLKIHIDSFVSLGEENEPNVYVVTASVGEVKTLTPGKSAYVKNTGTSRDLVLEFGIPKGEKGAKGDKGDKGDRPVKGVDYYTAEERQEIVKDFENDIENIAKNALCDKANVLVKKSETGKNLNIADCTEGTIYGLSIFGECSQDEVPSPTTPADVISVENPVLRITDEDGISAWELEIPYTLMGLKNKSGKFEARDEIVVSKGSVKLIQRCYKWVISSNDCNKFSRYNDPSTKGFYYTIMYAPSGAPSMKIKTCSAGCGNFLPTTYEDWKEWNAETLHFGQSYTNRVYAITASHYSSGEEFYNYLSNNGANEIYVIYQLATPIETDITDTDCGQALLSLFTHYPNTVISCDTDCAISYKADTTNAYNNLLGELDTLKQAIINLGGTI